MATDNGDANWSPEKLRNALASGNQHEITTAIEGLLRAHGGFVEALIRRKVPQVLRLAEPDDILNWSLYKVCQRIDNYDPARGSFRNWFLQIVYHEAINLLRTQGEQLHNEHLLNLVWPSSHRIRHRIADVIDGSSRLMRILIATVRLLIVCNPRTRHQFNDFIAEALPAEFSLNEGDIFCWGVYRAALSVDGSHVSDQDLRARLAQSIYRITAPTRIRQAAAPAPAVLKLVAWLDRLNGTSREILRLRWEAWPDPPNWNEIAQKAGLSAEAARKRYRRAVCELEAEFSDE